jgi:hypothetical protein
MANYAYNAITFITPNTEQDLLNLEFLMTNLVYLFETDDEYCNHITHKISDTYGTKKFNFDGRDNFNWLSDQIDYIDSMDVYTYDIQIESAWCPAIDRFKEWVQSIYPNIDVVGTCEEPGNCVYVNTDVDGNFYTTRYALSICKDDECIDRYYDSLIEVNEVLGPILGVPKDCDLDTVCRKIIEYNNSEEEIDGVEGISLDVYDTEDGCTFEDLSQFIPQPEN